MKPSKVYYLNGGSVKKLKRKIKVAYLVFLKKYIVHGIFLCVTRLGEWP